MRGRRINMSDVRDPSTDQPLPKPGKDYVQEYMIDNLRASIDMDDEIRAALIRGIEARRELGIRKYGRPLETFNGRDALADAWDEALDLWTYVNQLEMEDNDTGSLPGVVLSIVFRLTMRRINRGDCF